MHQGGLEIVGRTVRRNRFTRVGEVVAASVRVQYKYDYSRSRSAFLKYSYCIPPKYKQKGQILVVYNSSLFKKLFDIASIESLIFFGCVALAVLFLLSLCRGSLSISISRHIQYSSTVLWRNRVVGR